MIAVDWDVQRIVSVGAIGLTVVALALAIATCRRPGPVRLGFDLARLAAAAIGVVVMALVVGFSVAAGWVVLALGAGLLVGAGQGWFTRITWDDGSAVVAKTTAGIATWGVGLLVMQGAGVLARTGAVQLGQAISWFGVGVLAGTIVGRHARIGQTPPEPRRTGVTVAGIAVLLALLVGPAKGGDVRAEDGDEWVLVSTEVDPADEPAPPGWQVTTTSRGMSVVQDFGPDDTSGAEAAFEASWDPPPERLTPGDTVTIPITVSGRSTGNRETQYFLGVDVVMLVDGTWNNQGVGARANCAQTTVISGEYVCSEPETNTGEVFTTAPGFGESFSVGLTALNCSSACQVTWTYARSPETEEAEPAIAATEPIAEPTEEATDQATEEPTEEPTTTPPAVPTESDATGTTESTPSVDTEDEIDSTSAIAQTIGGLIAAVAVGIISAAEAGVLISSILGQGPLTPVGAAAEVDRVFTPAPPDDSASVAVLPPPQPPGSAPPAPPPPDQEPEPESAASARPDDPCAPLVSRYRTSLRRWMDVQQQIQTLENEYWALNEYVETGAEADFWGAATYLAALGVDTYRGPGGSSATADAVVSSFEQSLVRSVLSQALQAGMMGEEFDTEKVAEKALSDAAGLRSAEGGDPGQGAFGTFAKQSVTGLLSRLAGSGMLASVKASVESGVLDQAGARHLERSIEDSYARDIGPLVGVIFKGWEVWKKNEEWAAGAHARARIRNHMVGIDARINELEFDRGEIEIERDVDREQLAGCRRDHA